MEWPRLLDGGLATTLESYGCDLKHVLWSGKILLQEPEMIRRAHADFVAAGATVLSTASYQLTFVGLAKMGIASKEARELFRTSVILAREAARDNVLVAASMGPYGAFLNNGEEYSGVYGADITSDELFRFHEERAVALWSASPDFLLFETVPRMDEAQAIVRVLESHAEMRAVISFQFRDETHLGSGELFVPFEHSQILGLGANCCSPEICLAASRRFRLFAAYPNSGEMYNGETMTWEKKKSEENHHHLTAVSVAPLLGKAGVSLIGGCCRVGPEMIAKFEIS